MDLAALPRLIGRRDRRRKARAQAGDPVLELTIVLILMFELVLFFMGLMK